MIFLEKILFDSKFFFEPKLSFRTELKLKLSSIYKNIDMVKRLAPNHPNTRLHPWTHISLQVGALVLSVEKFILVLNSGKCYQQFEFMMI